MPDAAEAVFFARGFAAPTMDEVAVGAELSQGTLCLCLPSKDELYFAIVPPSLEATVSRREAVIARSPGPGWKRCARSAATTWTTRASIASTSDS
jgi:AcrR family transcriptional regulator